MASESKLSPNERLMRKRLAARLRQQRCRARKKEMSLAKKHQEQQEVKGVDHVPAQPRRPVVLSRNQAAPVVPRVHCHQALHRPHQPHKTHQLHRPHPPHHSMHHALHRVHCQQQPQVLHVTIPPPPPQRHPHHRQPHYLAHRPVHPLYMTELPTRTQSIGSVVSFDDGTCPTQKQSFESMTMYLKQENMFKLTHFQVPVVPTVSPTMSSKPVVEPDAALHLPSRSPTKEETAIDAMLSLRSGSFGA